MVNCYFDFSVVLLDWSIEYLFTPNNVLNILIYGSPFYIIVYRTHELLRMVQFFGPPCSSSSRWNSSSVIVAVLVLVVIAVQVIVALVVVVAAAAAAAAASDVLGTEAPSSGSC